MTILLGNFNLHFLQAYLYSYNFSHTRLVSNPVGFFFQTSHYENSKASTVMFVFWDSLGCVIFQDLNIWVSNDSSCKHWVISYSKKDQSPGQKDLYCLYDMVLVGQLSLKAYLVFIDHYTNTERERHAHKFFNQASLSCCVVPRRHDWARGVSYDFCSQNDYFPLQIGKVILHPHSVYHNKTRKKFKTR